MRAPWRRAAAIALATCGFSALPFLNGCKTDVETADAKVADDTDKAIDSLVSYHPQAAREAVANTPGTKGASLDAQIASHLLAAQADLDAASLLMSGPGASDVSAAAFKAVVDGKAQTGTAVPTFTAQDRAALRGIEQRQNRVEQLLSRCASIAQTMTLNNTHVAGYKALEPAKGREALQQATNAAQKGESGAWVPGTAPIPSLEGLKAREQDLQKQIADLTAQRDELNTKRGQALQDAAKFGQQADSTSGSESVGFFTQAANQRKEAADDEVKIAQLEMQLAPLQQELALSRLQEKAIGDVIASYGEQAQQLESGWKNIQQRIDQASALTKSLLEGTGASAAPAPSPDAAGGAAAAPAANVASTPRSLSGLATELDNESRELQSLRSKAIALLNSAYKHYDQAAGLAGTLTKNLTALGTGADPKFPDRRAWQERISLNSPAVFKLGEAAVQNRFARLYTDQYAEVARRNDVAALVANALKGSGASAPQAVAAALPPVGTVPVEIDTKIKGYLGDLRSDQPPFEKDASELNELAGGQTTPAGLQGIVATQADMAYHWAGSLINDAMTNAGQGESGGLLTNIAHAALMSNDYGLSQFYLLQGRQQEADAQLKAAVAERGTLVEASAQNLMPTALPPGLAFEVKPPVATTAPAPGVPGTPVVPGTPSAPGTPPSAGTPAAASPDQQEVLRITNEFFNDIATGQADKALALAAPDPRTAPMIQTLADISGPYTAYKTSVKNKFGDAANVLLSLMPDVKPDTSNAQVTITGNKARVSSPADPDLCDLTKGDGGWKVDPPSDAELQGVEQLKAATGVFRAVTPDIDAGKYATVQDLLKDMSEKFKAAGVQLPSAPATTPAAPPTGGTVPPAPATAPAAEGATTTPTTPGTTPPAEGTTPATTPTPGTTPPAEGTTPPPSTPAPGTPPAQ